MRTVVRRWLVGCRAIRGMQYLGEHPSKSTGGICAPRETEDTYLVSILICPEDPGRLLIPEHRYVTTYNSASETHIQL